MIKAVIFDLDGVLVSTDELHYQGWKRLAEELGITDFGRADNERQRGVSRMASLEIVLEKSDKTYTDEEKVELATRKNEYYKELLCELDGSAVLDGALDTLKYLKKRGIPVAVGSASANTPVILEKTGLAKYIDKVSCGIDVKRSKPAPDVFLLAAERLGVAPGDCIVVEDSAAGIEAAKTGGMHSLAVGPQFEKLGAEYEARNLAAFKRWDELIADKKDAPQKAKGNRKALSYVIIGLLAAAASLSAVALCARIQKAKDSVDMSQSKIVLYDGPSSLRDATEEDIVSANEQKTDISLLHSTDTTVTVNGYESYVYEATVNHSRSWNDYYLPALSKTPVTYFDFEGKATITVKVPDIDIDSVSVSPAEYNIEPRVNKLAHTVTFTVTEPDTYTVIFNDSPDRAVHIFANPLETDIPDFTDENVIYIGHGEWDIDFIVPESGQTIYISGGAVVHGIINATGAENVKVMGRGIIDGSHNAGWTGKTAYVPLKFDHCSDITIKDIIVLNPNAWTCQGFNSENGVIDGIKIISARPNGDGITLQSCRNYTVQNCFVRSWDDSLVIKNYSTNSADITFKNMQLWTDFAQSMEVGYETNKGKKPDASITDITFENITVLANYHKPVISVHNADDAAVSGITFRDIVVENAQMGAGDGGVMPYLIDLNIDTGNWASTTKRGTISDVLIENVTVLSGKFNESRISGYDANHKVSDIKIVNLNILGERITDFEAGKFKIDAKTTENLTIE